MSERLNKAAEQILKKKAVDEAKLEREYLKLKKSEEQAEKVAKASLSAIEDLSKSDDYLGSLINDMEKDLSLLQKATHFISDELNEVAPLIPGQITMIGAISGTGKSTIAAAIAHSHYKSNKKVLIISNEEKAVRVYSRIACAELDKSFNHFQLGRYNHHEKLEIYREIRKIINYVKIVDDPIISTTVESVVKTLYEAANYDIAIIDFLNRISKSTEMVGATTTDVLYHFKNLLTDYTQHSTMPVVVMAQLKDLSYTEKERDIENRIKWCKGFYEACQNVLEAIRLDGIPATTFYVQKTRFGDIRAWLTHEFYYGKFSYIGLKRLHELKDIRKNAEIQDQLEELQSTSDDNEDIAI